MVDVLLKHLNQEKMPNETLLSMVGRSLKEGKSEKSGDQVGDGGRTLKGDKLEKKGGNVVVDGGRTL